MQIFMIIGILLFVIAIGRGIAQFVENVNSPVLTVPATIADMRRRVHHQGNHYSHTYHITFLLENGERLELRVKRFEYNERAIGDRGMLTYQGTRYLGFAG